MMKRFGSVAESMQREPPMEREFSTEDLQTVFSRLAAEKWRAIIIGGQAPR